MTCAVIFGGTGFIGSFLAQCLVVESKFKKVYLFDIESVADKSSSFRRKLLLQYPEIVDVLGDVRQPIGWFPEEKVDLIANLAAVHREPGHDDYEYYETNMLGAEHVCNWAQKVGCNDIIFTSSISPYGPSEEAKSECSLPAPVTAYGGSKLVAEKIHLAWLAGDPSSRYLVIARPGVVFGPGEGGNVSRLVAALCSNYFFYMGNRNTRKAGVYVKELCSATIWVLNRLKENGEHFSLFNMTMDPSPSLEEYVDAICIVANKKPFFPSVPYYLALGFSHFIDFIAKLLRMKNPFSPIRVKKLVASNNIIPSYLLKNGYQYRFTLISALQDWREECSEEWS